MCTHSSSTGMPRAVNAFTSGRPVSVSSLLGLEVARSASRYERRVALTISSLEVFLDPLRHVTLALAQEGGVFLPAPQLTTPAARFTPCAPAAHCRSPRAPSGRFSSHSSTSAHYFDPLPRPEPEPPPAPAAKSCDHRAIYAKRQPRCRCFSTSHPSQRPLLIWVN